jgi:hypothetical protein
MSGFKIGFIKNLTKKMLLNSYSSMKKKQKDLDDFEGPIFTLCDEAA